MAYDMAAGLITEEQAQEIIEQNKKQLEQSLKQVIDDLKESYPQKMAETGKGELEYICVRLLLTSVPFKMPLYRVDFYDKNGQLDLIEHADYWDISPVSDIIYTDIFTGDNPYHKLSSQENYLNEQNWFENTNLLNEVIEDIILQDNM